MKKNLLLVFIGCSFALLVLSFKESIKEELHRATPVAVDTVFAIKDSTFNIHRNLFDLLDKSKFQACHYF